MKGYSFLYLICTDFDFSLNSFKFELKKVQVKISSIFCLTKVSCYTAQLHTFRHPSVYPVTVHRRLLQQKRIVHFPLELIMASINLKIFLKLT